MTTPSTATASPSIDSTLPLSEMRFRQQAQQLHDFREKRIARALEAAGRAAGAAAVYIVASDGGPPSGPPLCAWTRADAEPGKLPGDPALWQNLWDSGYAHAFDYGITGLGEIHLYELSSTGGVWYGVVAAFPEDYVPDDVAKETIAAFADMVTVLVELPTDLEHVEQRLRVDQALVDISHILVSSDDLNFEDILRIAASATGVQSAYFVRLPLDADNLAGTTVPGGDRTTIYRWTHGGDFSVDELSAADAGHADEAPSYSKLIGDSAIGEHVNAVPLLSADDRLFGYIGFEYGVRRPRWGQEDGRVLGILGDMLAGYFVRKLAERALSESEERWRRLVENHPDPILLTDQGVISYVNNAAVGVLGARRREELIGASMYDFISAEYYYLLETNDSLLGRGTVPDPVEHEMIRLDGEERIVESTSVPLVYEGKTRALTVMRDVTAVRLAEEGYRTFVETITEAICRIDLDKPIAREAAVDIQRRHIQEYGYVAECNGVMIEMLGLPRDEVEGKPYMQVFRNLRGSVLNDFIQNGYRLKNREVTVWAPDMPPRHLVINAVGTLERGRLSRIWGSCIDVTERTELERRIVGALEEQQQKIGRDLHDGVGQLLTGVRMLSQNLAERLEDEEHASREVAQKVANFAVDAADHIRDIYRGLTPAQLYHEGLSATLNELCHNVASIPHVTCEFVRQVDFEIEDRDTKLHLFRIAQEAVNNSLKHADPSQIVVYLGQQGDEAVLTIQDDGVGLPTDFKPSRSIGFDSMKYRAGALGATLEIDSADGHGTRVTCRMPLNRSI